VVTCGDRLDGEVLRRLSLGVRLVVLRRAGFNHVDLEAAAALGIAIGRMPEYSPYAVAEHTAALVLTLNRKIHRAHARVRDGNFALDGLLGFDLHGRTVDVVGTGKIGECFCRIMSGFGCRLLTSDPRPNPACEALDARYMELSDLLTASDILSADMIRDDVFARLLTFPNVVVTGHQAFFTEDALAEIANITLANLAAFESTVSQCMPYRSSDSPEQRSIRDCWLQSPSSYRASRMVPFQTQCHAPSSYQPTSPYFGTRIPCTVQ
jgi:lactate dehydrogenase-like 2-hydroxyacid dehydrogenase